MDPRRLVKVSKYLSRHLRHEPEWLGLEPEPGGWFRVDDLPAACAGLPRDPLGLGPTQAIRECVPSSHRRAGSDPQARVHDRPARPRA